jgi:alpha-mannosidase
MIRGTKSAVIENQITGNFNDLQGWRFAFDIPGHKLWHEEVGAVIEAELLDRGGHYAPRNARYDWLTLNHFALLANSSGRSAVLSNADCFFMRYGESSVKHLDTSTPTLTVLAGGQVDGEELGISGQHGDSLFLQRFALTTGENLSHAEAMRFSLEHQNPPLVGKVGFEGNHYPQSSYSVASVDNPGVLVWALKPAEDGIEHGIVVRLWNLSSQPERFKLSLGGGPIVQAVRTSHIETDIEAANSMTGTLNDALVPQQFKTYRLIP